MGVLSQYFARSSSFGSLEHVTRAASSGFMADETLPALALNLPKKESSDSALSFFAARAWSRRWLKPHSGAPFSLFKGIACKRAPAGIKSHASEEAPSQATQAHLCLRVFDRRTSAR